MANRNSHGLATLHCVCERFEGMTDDTVEMVLFLKFREPFAGVRRVWTWMRLLAWNVNGWSSATPSPLTALLQAQRIDLRNWIILNVGIQVRSASETYWVIARKPLLLGDEIAPSVGVSA
jgi:hypothetical protein